MPLSGKDSGTASTLARLGKLCPCQHELRPAPGNEAFPRGCPVPTIEGEPIADELLERRRRFVRRLLWNQADQIDVVLVVLKGLNGGPETDGAFGIHLRGLQNGNIGFGEPLAYRFVT
jgi:hypothetical protein